LPGKPGAITTEQTPHRRRSCFLVPVCLNYRQETSDADTSTDTMTRTLTSIIVRCLFTNRGIAVL